MAQRAQLGLDSLEKPCRAKNSEPEDEIYFTLRGPQTRSKMSLERAPEVKLFSHKRYSHAPI